LAVLTGKNGALRWNGSTIGKVRSWSLSVNKDALETTTLGSYDRTYVTGLRGSTGTAELMYDPNEGSAVALLNSIFGNDEAVTQSVQFVLDSAGGKTLSCDAFLTSASPSVSVADIQTCSISFQISGQISGGF
jgi:hypothetical protein